MHKVNEIKCKQVCNKINKKDLPYKWDMNIYRGCGHGCIYCYAIYTHDYITTNGSYYEDLFVKVNVVEQLEKQLSSPSWKKERINIGSVTDSYQPIEAKYKIMPDILKLLIKYKNPCTISTKSDLILRDYDLIDELSTVTEVNIASTITCIDPEVRRKIEPDGKDAIAKIHMLKEFSKTDATTGFHHMPIIPYITDQKETIEEIYASAADSKVNYIISGLMYLRGKTRDVFFDFIRCEYPDLVQPLTSLYKKGATKDYRHSLYQMLHELRRKYHLSSDYMTFLNSQKEVKKVEGFKQLSLFEMNAPSNYQPSFIPYFEDKVTCKISKDVDKFEFDALIEKQKGVN